MQFIGEQGRSNAAVMAYHSRALLSIDSINVQPNSLPQTHENCVSKIMGSLAMSPLQLAARCNVPFGRGPSKVLPKS